MPPYIRQPTFFIHYHPFSYKGGIKEIFRRYLGNTEEERGTTPGRVGGGLTFTFFRVIVDLRILHSMEKYIVSCLSVFVAVNSLEAVGLE